MNHATTAPSDPSLLQLEVGDFHCSACGVDRRGGHVVLMVHESRAFCLECAKRLRVPATIAALVAR